MRNSAFIAFGVFYLANYISYAWLKIRSREKKRDVYWDKQHQVVGPPPPGGGKDRQPLAPAPAHKVLAEWITSTNRPDDISGFIDKAEGITKDNWEEQLSMIIDEDGANIFGIDIRHPSADNNQIRHKIRQIVNDFYEKLIITLEFLRQCSYLPLLMF